MKVEQALAAPGRTGRFRVDLAPPVAVRLDSVTVWVLGAPRSLVLERVRLVAFPASQRALWPVPPQLEVRALRRWWLERRGAVELAPGANRIELLKLECRAGDLLSLDFDAGVGPGIASGPLEVVFDVEPLGQQVLL